MSKDDGNLNLYKRHNSPTRGRHLIASQKILKNQLIFVERPLLSLQSVTNGNAHRGALVCRRCRSFIGGPDVCLAVVSGKVGREGVWEYYQGLVNKSTRSDCDGICCGGGGDGDGDGDGDCKEYKDYAHGEQYKIVPCRNKCGELYCSRDCEEEMWFSGGHELMCTGLIPESEPEPEPEPERKGRGEDDNDDEEETNDEKDNNQNQLQSQSQLHPLLEFKLHAVQTNEIFLMVGDLVATVVSLRRQQIERQFQLQLHEDADKDEGGTLEELMEPYLDFTLKPWWEVATEPLLLSKSESESESDPMRMKADDEAMHLSQTLKELCSTSSSLLKDAFRSLTFSSPVSSDNGNKQIFVENKDDYDKEEIFRSTLCRAIDECVDKYDMFSESFFGKIIGSFEQNALGIRARHPLCRDVIEDEAFRKRGHANLINCFELAGMIEGSDPDPESDEIGEVGDVGHDYIDENIVGGVDEEHHGNDNEEEVEVDSTSQEEEYSYDEIAGFIAGLQIDEEGNDLISKKNKDDGSVHDEECDSCHDDEENIGDDLDALFTPLDGTAMYYTTCKMNHSCTPNVITRYTFSCSGGGRRARWGKDFPLVVSCNALRDIDEGEELCISYINSDMSYEERSKSLENYGFKCNCNKCIEDRQGNRLKSSQCNSKTKVATHEEELFCEEDDLFGCEDDDTEDGKNDDNEQLEKDDSTNGTDVLVRVKKNLDNMFSSSSQGSIPINIAAPAISFALQLGCQVLRDIDSKQDSENLDNSKLKQFLTGLTDALHNQDYVKTLENAICGEESALDILHSNRGWPNVAHREAHGCFAVSAALVYAKSGNFLPAMRMLDKALIFGLPRQKIKNFLQIIELQASNTCALFNNRRIGTIPDYRKPKLREFILKDGLSAKIQYPIMEVDAEGFSIDLFQSYFKRNQPILIRGFAKSWPALEKWRRLEFFTQKYGHRLVPIEKGIMTEKSGLKEQLMALKEFLHTFLCPNSSELVCSLKQSLAQDSVAYLAQHQIFEQIPGLFVDLDASPSLCGKDGPSHINAWIGTGGTRTPLHYDSYDNLFVQVIGSKYVRLYSPKETENLYVMKEDSSSYGKQGNFSSVDCELEDFSLHPKAKHAKYTEAILFPGDALFIPCRQWHYLRSCSNSMSVNFWF